VLLSIASRKQSGKAARGQLLALAAFKKSANVGAIAKRYPQESPQVVAATGELLLILLQHHVHFGGCFAAWVAIG
jgi:hypothetical protein